MVFVTVVNPGARRIALRNAPPICRTLVVPCGTPAAKGRWSAQSTFSIPRSESTPLPVALPQRRPGRSPVTFSKGIPHLPAVIAAAPQDPICCRLILGATHCFDAGQTLPLDVQALYGKLARRAGEHQPGQQRSESPKSCSTGPFRCPKSLPQLSVWKRGRGGEPALEVDKHCCGLDGGIDRACASCASPVKSWIGPVVAAPVMMVGVGRAGEEQPLRGDRCQLCDRCEVAVCPAHTGEVGCSDIRCHRRYGFT